MNLQCVPGKSSLEQNPSCCPTTLGEGRCSWKQEQEEEEEEEEQEEQEEEEQEEEQEEEEEEQEEEEAVAKAILKPEVRGASLYSGPR